MSGRTLALIADTPKVMTEGNWRVGIFVDEDASDEQMDKLTAVFGGQKGGPMAGVAPLIGEVVGVERAHFDVVEDGLKHSVRIGDAIDFEIEDIVPFGIETGEPARLVGVFHPVGSELTAAQQDGSYSLAALADQLDVATAFARAVSIALAALLLLLAFRAAREPGREDRMRDRRSFTLALAAALTLTPVVWNHYLLLLFVPVAIARPRLSGLWGVPFAANCLYVFDSYGPKPTGLPPRLAIAAIVVVTIVLSIDAQARPRSNALRPMWLRLRRRRFWRSVAMGLALVSALALAFVATPELLNDRPYNPLGRDTSHAPKRTGSGGDFGQQ